MKESSWPGYLVNHLQVMNNQTELISVVEAVRVRGEWSLKILKKEFIKNFDLWYQTHKNIDIKSLCTIKNCFPLIIL